MSWLRIDDRIAYHAKTLRARNEAFGAWVRAAAWSAGNLTDGVVPLDVALNIAPQRVWDRLLEVEYVDAHPDGYVIHDYLDWNPSAADVEEGRKAIFEARSAAGRKGGIQSAVARRQQASKQLLQANEAIASQQTQQTHQQNEPPSRTHPVPIDPSGGSAVRSAAPRKAKNPKDSEPRPEPEEPKAETPVQIAWRVWRKTYAESLRRYGTYVSAPEDGKTMQRVSEHALKLVAETGDQRRGEPEQLEALLRHWFREYLRDDGMRNFLVEQRHPLRCFERGIPTYGSPWAKQARQAPREPPPAPEVTHERKAPPLDVPGVPIPKGFLAGIGTGGG